MDQTQDEPSPQSPGLSSTREEQRKQADRKLGREDGIKLHDSRNEAEQEEETKDVEIESRALQTRVNANGEGICTKMS